MSPQAYVNVQFARCTSGSSGRCGGVRGGGDGGRGGSIDVVYRFSFGEKNIRGWCSMVGIPCYVWKCTGNIHPEDYFVCMNWVLIIHLTLIKMRQAK